jgi:DNA mismatch repair protein MutH
VHNICFSIYPINIIEDSHLIEKNKQLDFQHLGMEIEYIPFDEDGCPPGTYALAGT